MPIIDDKGNISAIHWMWWTAAIVVFLLVVSWGIVAATFGLRVATASLVGRGEARIQIQSAEFRITAYNHFFDLCAAVQGNEAQIDALGVQLEQTTDERSKNIVLSSLTGVTAQRGRSIAKYNQDALKDYTQGQFRDVDLPYQLGTAVYEGEKTTCALQ